MGCGSPGGGNRCRGSQEDAKRDERQENILRGVKRNGTNLTGQVETYCEYTQRYSRKENEFNNS